MDERGSAEGDAPVIVGVASVANRADAAPTSVVELMTRAVAEAIGDVEAHGSVAGAAVADMLDLVITPRGTWSEQDPGRAAVALAAEHLGARADRPTSHPRMRSIVTEIGVLQQTAVHRAVEELRAGARAVLVLGGEAKFSADRRGAGRDTRGDATTPDEVMAPHGDIVHHLEIERGVVVPAQQYALIESALARAAGRNGAEHERHIAELWARGSEAVAGRPDAWRTEPFTAAELLSPEGGNRMIAEPYRRSMVSSWMVDQAVALVFTTAATARAWGVPEAAMVGLVGSATTDHMVPLVARDDITACPALGLGAAAIEAATGRHPRDADVVDLYSCFPSAVGIAARDLGLDVGPEGIHWTATGGMAAFGGPFNSYALHGIAAVAAELRSRPDTLGVTTCVSGLMTKASVALWCTGPGPAALIDVSEADRAARRTREVRDHLNGEARTVAETACPQRDGSVLLIRLVEDDAGRRTLLTEVG